MILSLVTSRGPSPDSLHYDRALVDALDRVRIDVLLADAGYDSERAHVFARKRHGVRTIIPSKKGRPTHKVPTGRYRRLMSQRFDKELYGQRWQVETVFSMMKRNLGSALRARRYWSQCREAMLRAIAHNIAILYTHPRFSTEQV